MGLKEYLAKRNLKKSKEPGLKKPKRPGPALKFVVQEHHASHLHYDLRLEAKGVLKSWAIPKKPSRDTSVKRLAIMVEDHPYAYKDFEGVIPEGYGAGTVSIWDKGTYDVDGCSAEESEKLILQGLKKGKIHFCLHGKKLKGNYALVRYRTGKDNEWLLLKYKKADRLSKTNRSRQKA
jgi:bifunctional non-homologous end joining protein LigD